MPINAYTGLMGSGKSFEVVASVIVPAVAKGRRVVTNVDGVDNDKIRAYAAKKFSVPVEQLGEVVTVSVEQVKKPGFFPRYSEVDGAPFWDDSGAFIKGGDLVCIDEAWRPWGTGSRISEDEMAFFREHRHYRHPVTNVTCDLVVMVQDIDDLHKDLKRVVELSFRTTKAKEIGLDKAYRVEMWAGHKLYAKNRSSVETKTYNPEIFPLYSSYAGGTGKEVQVDKRQNVLRRPIVYATAALVPCLFLFGAWGTWRFFSGAAFSKPAQAQEASAASKPAASQPVQAPEPKHAAESGDWRVVGTMRRGGVLFVLLRGEGRPLRAEPSYLFRKDQFGGWSGEIDGQKVTMYSGKGVDAATAAVPGKGPHP